MTPKEATRLLKNMVTMCDFRDAYGDFIDSDPYYEALDVAIAVLNDSDCISRAAAIDAIRELCLHYTPTKSVRHPHMNFVIEELESLPSAQPDLGKPVGDGRPLADSEVVPRLRDIQKQIGGSYAIDRAIEVLEELPPAQPEPKQGRWIKISPANIYECSECGKNVMTDDISEYDFCHGCGADMRGEQE